MKRLAVLPKRIAMAVTVIFLLLLFYVAKRSRVAVRDRFASVSDLVANGSPNSFQNMVEVLGYWFPNDGGGGRFYLTNTVAGTNTGLRIFSGLSGWSWQRA